MDKKSFFENLIGKRFWYLSGETVQLAVEGYSEEHDRVVGTATLKDGTLARSYLNATYLYETLKDKKLQFL